MTSDAIYTMAFDESRQCIDSEYYKGVCYSFGYHVKADQKKAKEAYIEGVKKENAKCKYGLAVLLMKSSCINEQKEARQLFYDAFENLKNQAIAEDAISQRMVSCYYLFGDRGVEKNLHEAKKWLVKAAENADMEAQMNLAHCYEVGMAFEKNNKLAIEWYTKAAVQGNKKAEGKLEKLKEIKDEKIYS